MATRLEALDELIALASHAGLLGSESIAADAAAYGKHDRRLTLRAANARAKAVTAERALSKARADFLKNTGSWNWAKEVMHSARPITPEELDVAQHVLNERARVSRGTRAFERISAEWSELFHECRGANGETARQAADIAIRVFAVDNGLIKE